MGTIGTQPSPAQANSQIGNLAVQLRNTFDSLDDFILWFNTHNDVADIETEFGLSSADAQTMQATVGNLQTLVSIFKGQAVAQALPFDFRTNSAILWGGV